MSNYRPITVLPTLSKILERFVHTQIYNCWRLTIHIYIDSINSFRSRKCGVRGHFR
jgi:hypothetical protein